MMHVRSDNLRPRLSICIPTYNRADLLGVMLDSILAQDLIRCEIIILDGGSTDHTAQVVAVRSHLCERLLYVRREQNWGVDSQIDGVIQQASGDYCWLVPDDDLMKPGSVARVLDVLEENHSLVIANVDVKDFSLQRVERENHLRVSADRLYHPEETDAFFKELGWEIGCLDCIIVNREIWNTRERKAYYGTYFVFIGVIFQKPLPGTIFVIAQPLITVRRGSHSWLDRQFEIVTILWPSMVWAFPLSLQVRRDACSARRWARLALLLHGRGAGKYSLDVYKKSFSPRFWSLWQHVIHITIAVLPKRFSRMLFALHFVSTEKALKFKENVRKLLSVR